MGRRLEHDEGLHTVQERVCFGYQFGDRGNAMAATQQPRLQLTNEEFWARKSPHDLWMESTGIPIHQGYFIPDARTVEVGPWEERECNAAFLKLAGQEGVTEARVTEIPAGATLPAQRFAF